MHVKHSKLRLTLVKYIHYVMQHKHKEHFSAFNDTLNLNSKVQLEKITNVHACKALPKEEHLCVAECAHLNVSTCVWIAVLMDVPVHLVRRQWTQLLSMPAGH